MQAFNQAHCNKVLGSLNLDRSHPSSIDILGVAKAGGRNLQMVLYTESISCISFHSIALLKKRHRL